MNSELGTRSAERKNSGPHSEFRVPSSEFRVPSSEELSLVARLAEDMNRRWHQGERPAVEEYLSRHPELQTQPEAAVELIYEEICLRQELNQPVATEEVLARFPHWREQLLTLLDCHQTLAGTAPAPRFPAVGDTLGDCRLLAEIGRGTQGRVFLAVQPALADRSVVLKVVPLASQEHLSLARLQHTNIVPVHSVHDDPERHLRALCMPCFGGAPLDRLLAELQPTPVSQRSGQHLVAVLDRLQATAPVKVLTQDHPRTALAAMTYVQAVCSLGACLADALHYAHERGLLHLDLKPSNVLLAADGQPMLLDFHLARPPILAWGPVPTWLGGTPGYMAPEHKEALNAIREARPITVAVDARADVYSLGVLLYEALGGSRPTCVASPGADAPGLASSAPAASLRKHNPQVSVGLADILARCLAEQPQQRYASAAELAADLRRHLDNQPLRGVANRSWIERWRKWRLRRPQGLLRFGVFLVAALVAGLVLTHASQQLSGARQALKEGREQQDRQQHQEAVSSLKRARDLIGSIPLPLGLRQEIHDELRKAERAQAVQELHGFAEQIRALGSADVLPANQMRLVEVQCQRFWDNRRVICERLRSERPQVQVDLLDLAILWTSLRVRTAQDKTAARREALQVLAQAEELFGRSPVLRQERIAHAEALGLTDLVRQQGPEIEPRTPWEHLALGRAALQADPPDLDKAEEYLRKAHQEQQGNLWANFYRGKCHYQRGAYTDALSCFSACVALAPNRAWCWCNRGLACDALDKPDRAIEDYSRALQLDRTQGVAALYRGKIHWRQGRPNQAAADFRYALDKGVSAAQDLLDRLARDP